MRLPFLLYPNPTTEALNKQGIAAFACLATEIDGEADSCSHRDSSGRLDVLCSQFRVVFADVFCLVEQGLNALSRDLFNAALPHLDFTNK